MLAWDDYRVVLAIARARKLSAASEALGVTLSTVFRRLERIEEQLGTRLFDRQPGGYKPTEAGKELAHAAERMEQEALAGDLAVTGRDQRLHGTLRVTATEALATCFLARHIPMFHAQHPGLLVEIICGNQRLSLADREADVALRPGRPKEETLVGRKIGTLAWGIYAAPPVCARLSAVTNATELSGEGFVGWEGNPAAGEIMAWLESCVPGTVRPYSSSSLITNAALAAAGKVLVPLPCFLGSVWPGLQAVLAPVPGIEGELWIVMHQDLRHNARVRALVDHLLAACEKDRELFTGAPAQPLGHGSVKWSAAGSVDIDNR